jgi:hypothetical protein
MTKEDIIRMAQETGVTAERVRDLVNFAALVASAEREAILAVIGDNQCECRCSEVVRDRGQA